MNIHTIALLIVIALPACAHSSPPEAPYDLESKCKYSFKSDQEFKRLSEADACTLNKAHEKEEFFSSYVSANADILGGDGAFGNFSLSKGKPELTIKSYEDDDRGVTQKVIRSKQVSIPNSSLRSHTVVSVISVTYSRQQANPNVLEDVDEMYECWNNISYGKTTAVLASLCSVRSDPRNEMSMKSWQANLIRSLKVD